LRPQVSRYLEKKSANAARGVVAGSGVPAGGDFRTRRLAPPSLIGGEEMVIDVNNGLENWYVPEGDIGGEWLSAPLQKVNW